jgi:hypothetical protein
MLLSLRADRRLGARSPSEGGLGLRSTVKVCSTDGTAIAFDRIGHGSPVILVDGALCSRAMGPSGPLAKLLAQHFTVFTYDRTLEGQTHNVKAEAHAPVLVEFFLG